MSRPGRTVVSVRRDNLGAILEIVHRDGAHSRAELTDRTGLNRSTVADLVGTLVDEGLVEEGSPEPSRRVGRPSPVVRAARTVAVLAVNPEVDAVEFAAVGLDQGILATARIVSDHLITPEETAALAAEVLTTWRDAELAGVDVIGVGIAVPGLVRAEDGLVRTAPHLGWRDAPLREQVSASTGLPVVVGNDATLGAIAEHLFGAARGVDHVVYLNGGASGIGGGIIAGGAPLTGAGGFAGEFGQNRPSLVDPADRQAPGGTLEDEIGRTRLLAAAGLAAADDDALAEAIAAATAGPLHDEAARQRRILATALANVANVLNPTMVVLGGFLAGLAVPDADALLAAVRAQAMPGCADGLRISPAALGGRRLLIGAAEAAFAPLLADPSAHAPRSALSADRGAPSGH